ncbi:unnamed protein product [marine sediment metagenome]|uniref:Uncharacterized protein n=1 Tax=marine sediment metagenome TaxID=412755 RepID=X1FAB8_9ZZZZ
MRYMKGKIDVSNVKRGLIAPVLIRERNVDRAWRARCNMVGEEAVLRGLSYPQRIDPTQFFQKVTKI